MGDDLSDSQVFADELQARGDPRGELLALELAAHRATTSAEARRLNREAQRIRDAHPALVWPEALRNTKVDMRAGFVLHGTYEELFASDVPSELALSVRSMTLIRRRLEDTLPELSRARAGGLALDWLVFRPDAPSSLAGLRVLGAVRGRWPAVRDLTLEGPFEDVDALAGLTGLEELTVDGPLDDAELRSLAGLELKRLRVRAKELNLALVEPFGETLESLVLSGYRDSLASLGELPRLRALNLGQLSVAAVAELARFPVLERLAVSSIDPDVLEALRPLRLKRLYVGSVPAELLPALASLTNVEELDWSRIVGEHVDLTPLLARPRQRKLWIRDNTQKNQLILPANIEELVIVGADGPLAIVGTPSTVEAIGCDPRCLPPSLLLGLRHLVMECDRRVHTEFLAELPQACPNLESFVLICDVRNWQWSAAPQILPALPHLRRCSLYRATMGEVAEAQRAFPDLDMNRTSKWPRNH